MSDGKRLSPYIHLVPAGLGFYAIAYGLSIFSSPMPLTYGYVELCMGIALVLSMGCLLTWIITERLWTRYTAIFKTTIGFLYLILAPLAIGFSRGYQAHDIFRDLIPCLFLGTAPILYFASAGRRHLAGRLLIFVVLFVGIISLSQYFFGIQRYWGTRNFAKSMEKYLVTTGPGQQTYVEDRTQIQEREPDTMNVVLAPTEKSLFESRTVAGSSIFRGLMMKLYDPALLFCCIWMLLWASECLISSSGNMALALLALLISALCAYGYTLWALRAPVAILVAASITFYWRLFSTPMKKRKGWFLFFVALFLALIPMHHAFHGLLFKQRALGLNNKGLEFAAVYRNIGHSAATGLFGLGWGALFENPAAGAPTRFTHSIFSFYLLKTGLVGLLVLAATSFLLLSASYRQRQNISLAQWRVNIAGWSAIAAAGLTQATFKTMSFNIIFALVLVSAGQSEANTIRPSKSAEPTSRARNPGHGD